MNARFLIPNSFTFARLLLFPEFLLVWHQHLSVLAFGTLLLVIGSDALDGYAARKLNAVSSAGAWFDVCADFAFVFGAFTLFTIHGVYPFWVSGVVAAMFGQFFLTNLLLKQIIYDPAGKYFGRALFAVIGLTILMPTQTVCAICSMLILFAAICSASTRLLFLWRHIMRSNQS